MTDNLPVNWADQMAAMANAEARQEVPEVGTFSFKSGILSYGGTPIPGGNIDLVVLAAYHENRYYPEEYDADNIQSPLCWAFSADGMDMAPDAELVTQAQSPTCVSCPQNQWGSHRNGRGGKACGNVRRFIAMSASDLENIKAAPLAMGTISPTNAKYWSNFVNTVAATLKRPSWSAICKLTCQPDQKTMVRLSFTPVAAVAEEYLSDLMEKRDRAIELLTRPYAKREDGWDKPKEAKKGRKF